MEDCEIPRNLFWKKETVAGIFFNLEDIFDADRKTLF